MTRKRKIQSVLHVTKAKFPPEIRVMKEAVSLQAAGYKTAVLCPPSGEQNEYELVDNIEVFRPKILRGRSIFDRLLGEALFFSPSWFKAVREIMTTFKPDVLHIHDIWLGRICIKASGRQSIVLDLHENMPAAVHEYRHGYKGLFKLFMLIFQNRQRIFRYERSLVTKSHLTLVVVEEAKRRVTREHPRVNAKRVVNVENLESKKFISKPSSQIPKTDKSLFNILYIGGFGPHRGLDTLVLAMREVKLIYPKARLDLVGARRSQYLEILENLIRTNKVEDVVNLISWVDSDKVLSLIKKAHVCCVPHHSNPHTDNTIPHKLFQYMISERAVLVSSSAPLARTVRAAKAGLIFKAGDPFDCAAKIMKLIEKKDALKVFGKNGYDYVINKGHNWEEVSEKALINAYKELEL